MGLWWGYRPTTTPPFLLFEYLNSIMLADLAASEITPPRYPL